MELTWRIFLNIVIITSQTRYNAFHAASCALFGFCFVLFDDYEQGVGSGI